MTVVVAWSLFGCGQEAGDGHRESILDAPIPGASDRSLDTSGAATTRLLDVHVDWVEVSVTLAQLVQREGWTIESFNCVGTGNDVIAKKQVNGQWLLLESGAGERGAGIIIRPDPLQQPPAELVVSGRCSNRLVETAF